MGKLMRQILTVVLTICIILSEWGTYEVTVNAAGGGLSISGASTIKILKKGNAWTCKGTISSNYILKEVKGTIYESDGLTVKYRKSVYPNSYTYTLQNGEIDKALLFNELQAGVYYYTIVAADASGICKTLINNKFTVQGSGASKLKITGASNISTLKQGSSWTCRGTVSSNYVIREVMGTIYESDGIKVIYRALEYPNSKSYKIQNNKIDKELLFNMLSAGTYYYTIVASDASGKTLTLVRNKFTVQGKAASTLKITGASTISTLKQGESWTCKGKISSNYLLREVRGTIYESDGITVKYRKSAYPNSKSYMLQNREIDKALLFDRLSGGTYHYTIVASDESGKTLTLVNNKFTVQGKEASALKITGANAPGALSKGASWSCVGTVSSNYKISKIVGTIYAENGTTKKFSKTVTPKKTSYALYNSAIDNALKFNKLAVGSYYYTITASDVSGKTQVLVNERFEVKKSEKIYESPLKVKARFTTNFNENGHRGVDLAAPKGTAIYSLAAGKVVYSQYDNSYGNFIVIKHTDGMYSLYAHMKSKSHFKVGNTVKKGVKIGEVGSTGNSTGNHLHLELATGQVSGHYLSDSKLTYLVDPKQYINF